MGKFDVSLIKFLRDVMESLGNNLYLHYKKLTNILTILLLVFWIALF